MLYCAKCRLQNEWPAGSKGYTSVMGRCEICGNSTVPCYDVPSRALPDRKTENEDKSQEKIGQKPHKKPSGHQDADKSWEEEVLELVREGGVEALMEAVQDTLREVHSKMMTHAPPNALLSIVVRMAAVGEKPEVALAITNEEDVETLRKQVAHGTILRVQRPRDGDREGKKQE